MESMENRHEKIFAISDVHGCLLMLKNLVGKLPITEEDTIVFLGDYIDRGSESKGVVDFVIDLKAKHNVVCLMGNHERMLLDYLCGMNRKLYLYNGGIATLDSYNDSIPQNHIAFFESLLPYYETDDYFFVHAGVVKNKPLDEQPEEVGLWIRDEFINSDYDFGKVIVFGHTPFKEPLIHKNKIGIDTGACFDGVLTCIELPNMKIYQEEGT